MGKVAALFVDPNGVYSGLEDVEVWDEARDARLYPRQRMTIPTPPAFRDVLLGIARPPRSKPL